METNIQRWWNRGFEGDKEALREMTQGLVDPYLAEVLPCLQ